MNSDKSILEAAAAQSLRLTNRLNAGMANIQFSARHGMFERACDLAKENQHLAEKLAILTRSMVVYTGKPTAQMDVQMIMQQEIPVEMGYTREGWFVLRLPLLLPCKEKGSIEYIRSFLYPALRRYFQYEYHPKFDNCVLIYRHIYDRQWPERQLRDMDNIEQNFVTDAVALYVMKDDDAKHCRHLYLSAPGTQERTEVYVVPEEEFLHWYMTEKTFPDAGPEIVQNQSLFDKDQVPKP